MDTVIRRAIETDAKRVWQIRNSPLVRKKSNRPGKIEFTEHLKWFTKKYFLDKGNYCFVLEKDDLVVGYCRLDLNRGIYLTSLAVDPLYQGQGLGDTLLRYVLTAVKITEPIRAEIRKGNEASTKLFLKNNFKVFREQKDKTVLYLPKQPKLTKEEWDLYKLVINQKPKKSDCLIWLQGDRFDRGFKILELFRKKFSPKIVVSGNNVLLDKNNISTGKMRSWLIENGVLPKEIIVDNDSLNTKDQARIIINLAKKNAWRAIVLVGSGYHQPRAFLTFLKQAQKQKWAGEIINQPSILPWDEIPDGGNKAAGKYLEEEFGKIMIYKEDLASKKAGIKYLLKFRG